MKKLDKEGVLRKYKTTFAALSGEKPLSPIVGMGMVSIQQAAEYLGVGIKEAQALRQRLRRDMEVLGMVIATARGIVDSVPGAVRHPDGSYDLPLENGSMTHVTGGKYTYFSAAAVKRLAEETATDSMYQIRNSEGQGSVGIAPITVSGRRPFMDGDIPVVLGGFEPNAKCICDKTVAELHCQPEREIRKSILRNIVRFKEGVDFIDFGRRGDEITTLELLSSLGYSKQSVAQAEHIYILSERGYAKLVKIMDTDKAWDVYEHLLDEYFHLREETRQSTRGRELPKDFASCLRMLADEVEYTQALEAKVEENRPKVAFAEAVAQSNKSITVAAFAKILYDRDGIAMGRNTMFRWLREQKLLDSNNYPYQQYMNAGYFEVSEVIKNGQLYKVPFITGKGQIYLSRKLMEDVYASK